MRNRLQTLNTVVNILGSLLIVLAGFLLLPLIMVLIYGEFRTNMVTVNAFVIPAIAAFLIGICMRFISKQGSPTRLQSSLVCSLGWLIFSALGAFPFVIGLHTNFLNGFFEAMSGFTTTGITMFTGLDSIPRSILFWRSLTQWIGGLGILTFFLAITYRGGSAHRLFGAESHKIGLLERPVPGLANTLKILWLIYGGFTIVVCFALFIFGMPFFDSLCHSFTALSTGGFSPHDASIGFYKLSGYGNYRIFEYILIIGMLMGGTNFLIHYRVLRGGWRALYRSTEMKYWWSFIVLFVVLILVERFWTMDRVFASVGGVGFLSYIERNLRVVIFQVVAIITTTGFATEDIGGIFFGSLARQLFLIMMVIGGCVGSTGGGLKVLRVSVLIELLKREIYRLRSPTRAVTSVIIDGRPIEMNEVYRISALLFAWLLFLVLGGAVTAFFSHLGAYESFSGMFSALGNIGPCYISVPIMGNLHPVIKLVYIIGMMAGRLEILPVLIIFSRKAWWI